MEEKASKEKTSGVLLAQRSAGGSDHHELFSGCGSTHLLTKQKFPWELISMQKCLLHRRNTLRESEALFPAVKAQ